MSRPLAFFSAIGVLLAQPVWAEDTATVGADSAAPATAVAAAPTASTGGEVSALPPPAEPASDAATGYRVVEGKVVAVTASGESALPIPEPVFGLYHVGNELFVARGAAGVSVYDVSAPLAPKLVRDVPTPGASATGSR